MRVRVWQSELISVYSNTRRACVCYYYERKRVNYRREQERENWARGVEVVPLCGSARIYSLSFSKKKKKKKILFRKKSWRDKKKKKHMKLFVDALLELQIGRWWIWQIIVIVVIEDLFLSLVPKDDCNTNYLPHTFEIRILLLYMYICIYIHGLIHLKLLLLHL